MKLLALDLSTTVTGWALFENGKLKDYGDLRPKVKGITKMNQLERAYNRVHDMSNKVRDVVAELDPDHIVIEEVNRGVNRIGQKSLDALHYFVLDKLIMLDDTWMKHITYHDSNGKVGWRPKLGLKLDASDKEWNKEARKYNKLHANAIKKKDKEKKAVIDWKYLSVRYVNKKFKLELDVKVKGHADIADAICLGAAHLKKS